MGIKVYDLGEGGVNVDKSHIRAEDNEASELQNATYDATLERQGGLTKRPGLGRFNTVSLGAPVLGGVNAPYKGTASAPATGGGGGGAPGDSGGTGQPSQGQGVGPGDAVSVAGAPTQNGTAIGVGVAGGVTGIGTKLFGGKRLILLGRTQTGLAPANYNGHGWYLSTVGFADPAKSLLASPFSDTDQFVVDAGPPGGEDSANLLVGGTAATANHPMTLANGVLYYAGAHERSPAAVPTFPNIRRLSADGKSDTVAIQIPPNPLLPASNATYGSRRCYITALLTEWGNGDAIWVAVYDDVTSGSAAGNQGRVLRITGCDSGAYAMTEVLNTLSTVYSGFGGALPAAPYCLENWRGRTFVGFNRSTTTLADPFFGEIYANPVIAGGWAYRFAANSTAQLRDVQCLCQFNGKLYVGYLATNAGRAIIQELTSAPDDSTPSVGWTATTSLTGSGGTTDQTSNGFYSMVVFGGALYASYWNSTEAGQPTAKIYKFDGTTWTTAYSTTTTSEQVPYKLQVDGSTLHAYGANPIGTTHFLSTTDGATWTNRDGNMETPIPDAASSAPVDVFFGIDQ